MGRPDTCRQCHAPVLRVRTQPPCAWDLTLDPTPLTPYGEYHALATGHHTATHTQHTLTGHTEVTLRGRHTITRAPALGPDTPTTTYDVHPTHQCHTQWPAGALAPTRLQTPTTRTLLPPDAPPPY